MGEKTGTESLQDQAKVMAEKYIVTFLSSRNYRIVEGDYSSDPASEILLANNSHRALLHVNAIVEPGVPAEPTTAELNEFKKRAEEKDAKPYFARVWVDDELKISKHVDWVQFE